MYTVRARADKADALRRASGSRTTISQEEIEHAQAQSAGELLQRVPGLQIRQEDQSGFRLNLGVRGLSPNRSRLVLLEEDGVPVVVSPYGEPELYYVTPVERIQSIDVLKGQDVLRYGPQTVGAAIQLHTWEPTEHPSWYTSFTSGMRNEYDSVARYSNSTPAGVGYVAEAVYKQGDGFRGMGFRVVDVFGKVRVPTGPSGELMIKAAVHYDLTDTTYTGLTDTLYLQNPRQNTVAPDDRFGIQRFELALAHDQRLTDTTRLHTSVFAYQMNLWQRLQDFDRSRLPGVDYVRVPDPSGLFFRNTTGIRDRVYDVLGVSSEVEQRFATGELRHKLLFGARGMFDTARRKLSSGSFPTAESGDLLTDDTTSILGLATWIEDQIAIGDLVLVDPAFRMEYSHSTDYIHRVFDDTQAPHDVHLVGSASSNGPTPGVGVVVGKPAFNTFTDFHMGYSAPRIGQAITPEGQDAHLNAETSYNFELGLRGRRGSWLRAEADVFFVHFGNELVSNNPLSGSTSEFIDGGQTQHLGFESTLLLRIGQGLALPFDVDLGGQYTFARSRFVGGTFAGHAVPYSPANTLVATLDVAHHLGFGAQVALSYVGPQYSDEENTVEPGPTGLDGLIPGYKTLDISARYRHPRTGLGFTLIVKNAMDQVYISDRLPNGIFTAGFRQILGMLSWSGG